MIKFRRMLEILFEATFLLAKSGVKRIGIVVSLSIQTDGDLLDRLLCGVRLAPDAAKIHDLPKNGLKLYSTIDRKPVGVYV